MKIKNVLAFSVAVVLFFSMSVYAKKAPEVQTINRNPILNKYQTDKKVQEVICITPVENTNAILKMYIKDKTQDSGWDLILATDAFIGKRGLGKEREGDLKTPLGEFNPTFAFGKRGNPGTTTDTIEETVEYNGISITIIDTAGIRYHTTNTIEKIGQERSKSSIEVADIILWITDSSIDFDDNDKQIADLLKDKQNKTIVILNKSDLQQKISLTELKKVANINTVINFSTVTKTPIETILNKIFELMNLTDIEENTNVLLNTRQYNLICKVQEHLNKILELINKGDSDEIVSFETQNALNSLNEILGIDAKEDILHTVFSKFCVGK